jgi:predicted NBD/HSP70 family sugar kinase
MYLTIDIGGTKTLVAVFSPGGDILQSVRFPTNKDYGAFINELASSLAGLPLEPAVACCVAVPGLLDRQRGVAIALGNLPWHDVPIQADISRLLKGAPVAIENDARLAGLAEAVAVNSQFSSIFYLTVSTGIGGALIHNCTIVPELQDIEIGKMPLQFEGALNAWENFAGGRYIVSHYGKRASEITDNQTWEEIGGNIAYGVAIVCATMQPEAIIFGGGVGQYADKFTPFVANYLKANLHPVVRQPQALLATRHAEDGVIHGAYEYLVRTGHGNHNTQP